MVDEIAWYRMRETLKGNVRGNGEWREVRGSREAQWGVVVFAVLDGMLYAMRRVDGGL
jgi:hypothetical protein